MRREARLGSCGGRLVCLLASSGYYWTSCKPVIPLCSKGPITRCLMKYVFIHVPCMHLIGFLPMIESSLLHLIGFLLSLLLNFAYLYFQNAFTNGGQFCMMDMTNCEQTLLCRSSSNFVIDMILPRPQASLPGRARCTLRYGIDNSRIVWRCGTVANEKGDSPRSLTIYPRAPCFPAFPRQLETDRRLGTRQDMITATTRLVSQILL